MRRLPAQIWRILRPDEKKSMGWLLACDIAVSIADIIFLALLLVIIQSYTGTVPVKKPVFPGWSLPGQHLLLSVIIFFLLFSCKNLAGFLVYRAQCTFFFKVASRISRDKLTYYLEGGYEEYVDTDSAVHIRQISYEPLEFCQHVLGGFQQMVTQAALILMAITGIIFFNAHLFFLLLVVLLPPVFGLSWLLKGRLQFIRTNARRSSERSLQHLQEALAGYVESNIYDRNEVFLQKYLRYQRQYNSHLSGQMVLQGVPVRMIEVFALLGVVILIAVNQWSAQGGSTSVITIGVFMAAAYKIIPGIVKILNLMGQINTYKHTLQRLRNGVERKRSVREPVDERIQNIRMEGVDFSYNGHRVLNDFYMNVQPGEIIGVAGESGKGKTTILNVLLGFLKPEKGRVLINGKAGMSGAYWGRIAYVKQQSFLIHDSIRHNITLNGEGWDEFRLEKAVKAAGLTSLVEGCPEGLDKVIMENGRNISGGQRQRIVLARALYKDADLIILDEPFNELDEESEQRLLCYLRQLAQEGKMVILITHNNKSFSFCNKIIHLYERAS